LALAGGASGSQRERGFAAAVRVAAATLFVVVV